MRWISQFDPYGYRLLAPGSFLIFVGIIFFIQQRGIKQFLNAFKGFLLVFAIISYLLSISYSIMQSSKFNPSYFQTIKTLEEKYADVEKNSIVVFAPRHIRYLYTDIQTRRPYFIPYAPYKETWPDFMKRISSNYKNIYLHIPKKELSSKDFDKSVVDFVKKYEKDTLVKLQ